MQRNPWSLTEVFTKFWHQGFQCRLAWVWQFEDEHIWLLTLRNCIKTITIVPLTGKDFEFSTCQVTKNWGSSMSENKRFCKSLWLPPTTKKKKKGTEQEDDMSSGRLPLRISFLTLKNGRFITTYCNYLLSLIFAKIVCFYLSAPRPGSIWHIICLKKWMNLNIRHLFHWDIYLVSLDPWNKNRKLCSCSASFFFPLSFKKCSVINSNYSASLSSPELTFWLQISTPWPSSQSLQAFFTCISNLCE